MKYDELLSIDDTDKKIIEILQEDPDTTHSVIAEKVRKLQPAVGARIIKLKRKHLLTDQIGAEFDKIPIKLARIEVSATNIHALWERFKTCPHIINCFKVTGSFNLMIEIVAPNVKSIDIFVDECLRKDEGVHAIRCNYVIDSLRPYIVPLSFAIERFDEKGCAMICGGPLYRQDLKDLIS